MTATNAEKHTLLVYDPTAEETGEQDRLAERLSTCDGAVIGLLDNTKDLVDVLLGEVQSLLQKDYPRAEFRYFRKESVSGAAPELMDQVAACHAVVTAIGD
jgi:hypothetical protein